ALGWTASNWLVAGEAPRRMGNDNFTASPSGAFATRDGLLNIAANQQPQFERLCDAVGRSELATDPRFVARADRLAHRAELSAELTAALAARSAEEWEHELNALGVPAARVLALPDVLDLDQVVARGTIASLDDIPGTD